MSLFSVLAFEGTRQRHAGLAGDFLGIYCHCVLSVGVGSLLYQDKSGSSASGFIIGCF